MLGKKCIIRAATVPIVDHLTCKATAVLAYKRAATSLWQVSSCAGPEEPLTCAGQSSVLALVPATDPEVEDSLSK